MVDIHPFRCPMAAKLARIVVPFENDFADFFPFSLRWPIRPHRILLVTVGRSSKLAFACARFEQAFEPPGSAIFGVDPMLAVVLLGCFLPLLSLFNNRSGLGKIVSPLIYFANLLGGGFSGTTRAEFLKLFVGRRVITKDRDHLNCPATSRRSDINEKGSPVRSAAEKRLVTSVHATKGAGFRCAEA